MRFNKNFKSEEEVQGAYQQALKGAVAGAARWALFTSLLGTSLHIFSPLFRSLTLQFKVFLGLASVTMGGMIEADRRMVAYEVVVRQRKRQEKAWVAKREFENYVNELERQSEGDMEERIRRDEIRSLMSERRGREEGRK